MNTLTVKTIAILVCHVLFSLSAANAAIYYVSPSGNDTNDGSSATPWLTIQGAIDNVVVVNGDTIVVKDGTYIENINVTKQLIIQSEKGYLSTTVIAVNNNDSVFEVTVDNVTIEGFTAYGANNSGNHFLASVYLSSANSCIIANNRCGYDASHFSEKSIFLISSDNNLISNNICNHSPDIGLQFHGGSDNNIAQNNTISNNGYDYPTTGSGITNSDTNNKLRGNIVENNTAYGVHIYSGTVDLGANALNDPGNNIITNNGSFDVYNGTANTINAYYNNWGTNDAATIDSHLRDNEEGGGEVLFDPWRRAVATPPAAGDGSSGSPYEITTLENLYWLSQQEGNSDATGVYWSRNYIQTADINASSTNTWDGGAGFSPIGNHSVPFTGSYDGQGLTVSGLFINRPEINYIGLFGYGNGSGTIENLGVINVNVTGKNYVGGLLGAVDYYTVNNCNSSGTVTGNTSVGGLVGNIHDTNSGGVVSNCYNTGSVSGSDDIGGLAGFNGCLVRNCYNTGSVSGSGGSIGGLIGYAYYASVVNSYNTGLVTGEGNRVGGLVGNNTASGIQKSYNSGSVTGNDRVGGLIGVQYLTGPTNCYNTGSVTGNDRVGGLVGMFDYHTISNCYSTGLVNGISNVGGLIGDYSSGSTNVRNSFWDTQTSGLSNSVLGTGKTTIEMTNLATFTDESTVGLDVAWDFVNNPNDDSANNDFWIINATKNGGYPSFTGEYTITADSTGNGSGTVSSDVGGINYNYPTTDTENSSIIIEGSSITLTATTGTGSTVSWSGCESTGGTSMAATCIFSSLDSNTTVTATFTLNTYTVTANAGGNGSGTVASNVGGISYTYPGTATGVTFALDDSSPITLTATAETGSTVSWTGCESTGGTTTAATCIFSGLDSDEIVTVTFVLDTYTVTGNAGGNGGGTVASDVGGISYPYPGTATGVTSALDYGSPITLTATAEIGSTVSWTGCDSTGGTTTAATCTLSSLDSNTTVTATFTLNTYTVTANAGGNGSGTVASDVGGISYTYPGTATGVTSALDHSSPITLTASAGTGSTVSWTGCESTGGTTTAATCIFSGLDSNKTVNVSFTLSSYTVNTQIDPERGSISPSSQSVAYGDTTSFEITSKSGYNILSATGCDGSQTGDDPFIYTTGIITAACTIEVTFTEEEEDCTFFIIPLKNGSTVSICL